MIAPHTVFWEAHYSDGGVLRESDGALYRQIDRSKLSAFTMYAAGVGELLTIPVDSSHPATSLFYRRRTMMTAGSTQVVYLFGFMPMGPVFLLDPSREAVWAGRWPHEYQSIGHTGVEEMPAEGERFSV